MSDAVSPEREAVFQAVLSRLRTRAPIMYNIWALVGRGVPRDVADLAVVVWAPQEPPAERDAMHQRVGAFVAHLNKRIAEHNVIIKPGVVRGSYRLYGLATWREEQQALRRAQFPDGQAPPLVTRNPRRPECAPRAPAKPGRQRNR